MGGQGSGPKRGSLNAAKNGASIDRRRLVVGELPKELLAVRREGRAYRRNLEAEVLRVRGEIDVTAAHHIDTASAATIHAGICRHLLRQKIKTMSTSDILACSREITKAKMARDAAVKALGLDRDAAEDVLARLYAPKQIACQPTNDGTSTADGAGGVDDR